MEEQERAEYQRFGAVLSDRASQALTIKIEIEMAVEKEREEKEKAKLAEKKATSKAKQAEEKVDRAIEAMVNNTDFTDKQIANVLGVEIERVRKIRGKMK